MSPVRFRQQLEGLLAAGYRFLPLGDVVDHSSRGGKLPARAAVVTFDDGFANVYQHAFPVLKELSVPATVFLVTGFIGSAEPFPFDRWGQIHRGTSPDENWRPLSWAEIEEMHASGLVEFGSHTHTHASFKRRPDDLLRDLRVSISVLNRRLGATRRPFSFPFGSARDGFVDAELVEAARRAGVTCALTTEIELVDPRTSPMSWGRLEIVQSDTPAIARAKMEGWFNWMAVPREGLRSSRRIISPTSLRGQAGRARR